MVGKTAKLNVRMLGGIWWIVLLIVGCLNVGSNANLIADPFYQGKRLTFMVDYSAGGPTDIECRLYIRHLGRHLAGKPTLVVRNRPGAGGVLAMNWLYERARRDGTVAGCQTASPMYMEWYVGDPQSVGLRANMAEIIPVMFTPVVSVGVVRKVLPPGIEIKQPEDILKAKGWIAGGFREDSTKDLKFRTLLDLVGANYKYATGYPGAADLLAAFMRREVDYVDGSSPFYMTRVKPVVVDGGQAYPIWYDSWVNISEMEPAYKSEDFVKKLTGKQPSGPLWQLFQISRAYRMILFPPGVPQQAVEALRAAFRSLGNDPQFLAEYQKIVGVQANFLTKQQDLRDALAPLEGVTPEVRELRFKYTAQKR